MISSFVKQSFIQISLFYILILKIVISCDKLDARVSLKVEGAGFHRLDHSIKVKQKKGLLSNPNGWNLIIRW